MDYVITLRLATYTRTKLQHMLGADSHPCSDWPSEPIRHSPPKDAHEMNLTWKPSGYRTTQEECHE